MGYAQPLRPVQDGHNPELHPRDWQGQLAAAARGPLQWGFQAFFLGFGGFYLASLVVTAVLTRSVSDFDSPNASHSVPLGPVLPLMFLPNLLLGLVPALFSWFRGNGPRLDFGLVPSWRDLRVGLACGGISLGLGYVVNLLLLAILPQSQTGGSSLDIAFGDQRTVWAALAALFVFVGAPLTEELLVRGALWGALEHYRIHRYVILVLTSMIFAFLHQDPDRTLALFCQGMALGSARMITGRIGSSMVAHATNNLIPALVLFLVG
jgi:hypothetical protein